ncbi:MAG TPA: DUF385 domain-containing protein [Myxococcales bacterium]|nr:DUF385 domain-containing protein [Myxococcales bacterium]HIK86026.1 DUF385 domain-containing protein [Myxococcales bacterium]
MGSIVIPQLALATRGPKSSQEQHPVWFDNLQTQPQAFMQLRDGRAPITANLLSEEEKRSDWQRLCENTPNDSPY